MGEFIIMPGKNIYGELTLDGDKTSVYIQDKESFNTFEIPDQCIYGILNDLTKVSLIQCITKIGVGTVRHGENAYHFANLFPHFVLLGDHHLSPTEKKITKVHFLVDDASTIFYDFSAFGHVIDARPYIDQIAHANEFSQEVPTGTLSANPIFHRKARDIHG